MVEIYESGRISQNSCVQKFSWQLTGGKVSAKYKFVTSSTTDAKRKRKKIPDKNAIAKGKNRWNFSFERTEKRRNSISKKKRSSKPIEAKPVTRKQNTTNERKKTKTHDDEEFENEAFFGAQEGRRNSPEKEGI